MEQYSGGQSRCPAKPLTMKGVMVATSRKFREIKRKMARDADEARIAALENEVTRLQEELAGWIWWGWHQHTSASWTEEKLRRGNNEEQQSTSWTAEKKKLSRGESENAGLKVRLIDYSKWDHIEEEKEEDDEEGPDEDEETESAFDCDQIAGAVDDYLCEYGYEEDPDDEFLDELEDGIGEENEKEAETQLADDPDGGSCNLTQDQSSEHDRAGFDCKDFHPNVEEEEDEKEETESEIESALSGDLARNKAIVLMKMQAAKRKIITHAARQGFCDLTQHQQQQQQIESYLQTAMQLPEREYSKEGSTALVGIIQKWQTEAMEVEKG